MLLMQRIEELSVCSNSSCSVVCKFLLAQRNRIKNLSLQQIADETFTSKSTVVRVAQKLGFSGWSQFEKNFLEECSREDQHPNAIDSNYPFTENAPFDEIAHDMTHLMMQSCSRTLELLDLKQLEKAVQILENSRRISMICVAPNLYMAELFKRKMLAIGRTVDISQPGEYVLTVSGLTELDCAVVISYSGNNTTQNPMALLPFLKEKKVKIIAITSDGDNLLRQAADATLTIESSERLYSKISTFSTEESILLLLNILYSCYFSRNYQQYLEYKIGNARKYEYRSSSNPKLKEP